MTSKFLKRRGGEAQVQRVAKQDELAELAEQHEQIVMEAVADSIVTADERRKIIRSLRCVRVATQENAIRTKLGMRMFRGGQMDREIRQLVTDYERLSRQEETSDRWNRSEVYSRYDEVA